jgi:hypothetical protein
VSTIIVVERMDRSDAGSMKYEREKRNDNRISRYNIYSRERRGSELGLPPPSVVSDHQ